MPSRLGGYPRRRVPNRVVGWLPLHRDPSRRVGDRLSRRCLRTLYQQALLTRPASSSRCVIVLGKRPLLEHKDVQVEQRNICLQYQDHSLRQVSPRYLAASEPEQNQRQDLKGVRRNLVQVGYVLVSA